MKKTLEFMYLSLFSIEDMALNCKADSTYTKEVIETILFFTLCDDMIDGHQYNNRVLLLEKDMEEFHDFMFKHVNFD